MNTSTAIIPTNNPEPFQAEITLPWPPSVNHYWCTRVITGRDGRAFANVYVSKAGKSYRDRVKAHLIHTNLYNYQFDGRVAVHLTLCPPDKRKRDVDNYNKGLLDALTYCQVWLDDEQIDDLRIIRGDTGKPGHVVLQIKEIATTPKQQQLI